MSFHSELVLRECYSQMHQFPPDYFYNELYCEAMRITIKGNKYTLAGDHQSFLTALDKTAPLKPEEDCPNVVWF